MKSIDDITKADKRSREYRPEWIEAEFKKLPVSSKVPKKIKEMVELAQELAYYGYFKYEFFNLGLFYLCLTLETAFRERYRARKLRFAEIIEKAKNDGTIPVLFHSKLTNIRRIRNSNAHPKHVNVFKVPIKGFHLIKHLINCIFDEKSRMELPEVFAEEVAESNKISSLFTATRKRKK
jgi:hypothetical protein